jgi:putative ABC transport system substrate-binding protein
MEMNNRRKLVIALSAGSLMAPLASFAQQQGKVWRVGFLSAATNSDFYGAFPQGMRELGYIEGKNLVIEWRFGGGRFERLPDLALELVNLKVDVIVASTTPSIRAAQKATGTIPIVMANVGDAVGSGFVKSLARPGGHVTGVSNIAPDLGAKLLEMLLSMVPKLSRVAVLVNPDNSNSTAFLKSVEAAARRSNVKILPLETRSPQEVEHAFSMMGRQDAQAVIVARDPFLTQQRVQISELAAKNRLPSICGNPEYVKVGGLLGYGANTFDQFRRAATYVDKILKGAKPGDLPVEQPMKFELIINRKTAKALGLTIPQSLLISADKVIE